MRRVAWQMLLLCIGVVAPLYPIWAEPCSVAVAKAFGAEFVFKNEVYRAPPVTYERPLAFRKSLSLPEEIQAGAEILSTAIGRSVKPKDVTRGGDFVGLGSFRLVYRDPRRPGWLLKIYRGVQHDSQSVAKLLQREQTMFELLTAEDFQVAPLEVDSTLIRMGIVSSQFVSGYSYQKRAKYAPQDEALNFRLALYKEKLKRFDEDFAWEHLQLWKMKFSSVSESGQVDRESYHSLDVFSDFRNIRFDYQTHQPVLIDY